MATVTHKVQLSGANNPAKQASKNAWNDDHNLTGTPNRMLGFNSSGLATDLEMTVNVRHRGALGTGTADDAPAFTAAIAALPSAGGRLHVPAGTYRLDSVPSYGTKSVLLDIDPDAVFTGTGTGEGKFGYMATNPAQLAVGPYVRSQTKQKSTNSNGGTAAFNVEFIQPTDYGNGQAVALYAGALARNANANANTWAANFVHRIETGALGTHQLLEADVDCFSTGATVKGISLSGAGTANPDIGIELTRVAASDTKWAEGINIGYAQNALVIIPEPGTRGIVLHGEAGNTVAPFGGVALSARQYANNNETILLQRSTDTAPTGFFLRAINAANSTNLWVVDIAGNMALAGSLTLAGKTLEYGAADSAGTGYRTVRVPN